MQVTARSDAELVRLAQQGATPGFAALLYRYGPVVRHVVEDDADPVGAVTATFVAAMRQLPKRDPAEPVEPWLRELAATKVDEPVPVPAAGPPPMDPDERDEIWAELYLRWPDGRVPRRAPRWLVPAAVLVVLLALAVLIPYVLLTTAVDREPEALLLEEVVARPIEADPDDVELEDGP